MENILQITYFFSLAIHILMIAVAVWRTWRGENAIDRLIAVELTSTLLLAVLVLLAIIERNNVYMDVALGSAAVIFIGTIALTRYIRDEDIF
jgi:multisubunit Na+/H+ antiporter MnhF subunit